MLLMLDNVYYKLYFGSRSHWKPYTKHVNVFKIVNHFTVLAQGMTTMGAPEGVRFLPFVWVYAFITCIGLSFHLF